ncbi:DNA polymerase IV [Candidatus Bathyarchaeota archaeon]|nr:DNA polymerase IV [Candidatus Bathyarchaeota archaeon]
MSPRIIIHVDLDAFYAAVEEREHPECKGKPVVVGADPKGGRGRGVVSTCNYEARQFGIRSGMPISKAWRLNKNAVFLPVNLELYEKVSSNIMRVLRSYGDKFEQVSIDEAFLDLSKTARDFEEARKLAEAIKADVLEKEKLTCSIGMGPNKLVAKIASDHQKPNGLTVVIEKDVESFLAPLPVHKLPGIGVKTNAKLNEMGVRTMGELASYDVARLREEFGVSGISFHQMAQGVDRSELVEERLPKSFSREHTFEEDTSDKRLILTKIDDLLERVVRDCKENGFNFKTLTLKIRYQDFETHTRSRTIPRLAAMPDQLKQVAYELAEPFLGSHKKIRLIGIKVSTLIVQDKQKTLI